MDALLAKLERRLGNLAIEQLPLIIVGGMACVFVLGTIRPEFLTALELDLDAVRRGQVWRLVSYLFLPRTTSLYWILLSLYFTWMVGSNLEAAWGTFKFNAYYVLGMLGTTLAAWLAHGSVGNFYLNVSLILAFATVFPNYEIYVFFVIPMKMKWLGILSGLFLVSEAVTSDWAVRAAIVAATSNYVLFFAGTFIDLVQGRRLLAKQAARRESFRAPTEAASVSPEAGAPAMGARVCAICSAREDDGADIRVCSCALCGSVQRTLCLEHARAHATASRERADA
jgi:membrane associated rhomboid family serine protease